MALSYNLGYQESISVHPSRRQIFAGKPYSTFPNIWEWLICWSGVHLSRMCWLCWSAKMDWCTLPHTGCPRILCSWSFSSAEKVLILFNKAAPAQNWQYFAQLCPEMQTFLFLYIFLKTKMTDYMKFLVPFLCSHSTTPWLWGKVHHIFVHWKSSRP